MAATDAASTADEFEEESISKCESLRLKNLAEQTYRSSNIELALKYAKRAHRLCPTLDGVSEMLTAFKILTASENTTTTPHWYKILEVEPFSHINSIKKQYKKLELILHPDKNTSVASEEAFKLVNEAFRVLNDKIRRKEYDMKLRIAMQTEAAAGVESDGGAAVLEPFWTSCSSCRLLHQFERKYLGHNLMCPNCRKSFKAVEVDDNEKVHTNAVDDGKILTRRDTKRKMSSVGDTMKRSEQSKKIDGLRNGDVDMCLRVVDNVVGRGSKVRKNGKLKENESTMDDDEDMMTLAEMQILVNDDDEEEEKMTLADMQRSLNDDDDDDDDDDDGDDEERMTLAEMQKLLNDDDDGGDDDDDDNDDGDEMMTLAEMQKLVKINVNDGKLKVNEKDQAERSGSRSSNSKNKRNGEEKNQDLDIMTVEDSDFYDFDEGRVEKSFKKGQIWALYDDDDGMPRHYGLIDEVVSTHPFEVNMSWLDPQSNGDDMLINLERTGFHISCGRFKVSKKTSVTSLNVFSHIVNCERAAREVHGLSMAYLEKVNGFKTIFRRREIGCHAIKWLEKHEVQLFSHQIPARKLSGKEVPNLSGDCLELDPASLPTQLLTTVWKK
ncbi:hypothetical protein L1987_41424 [Smallanthus sonchifolius]|uniref:Uncharacterized protein n=1 Tax=Smallanthus sonchifolius TaxID=185202 RepID=A0ACB9GU67_9ASTR|nr:hypothetical protein L1987_41424 [Smallanthus sonchifolius]